MLSFRSTIAALFLLTVLSTMAYAATVEVEVTGRNRFEPREVTIAAGDTVHWVWTGGVHTVTNGATSAAADAGMLFDKNCTQDSPEFSFTFTEAGAFPYFCRPHEFADMRGLVTVADGGRSIGGTVQTAVGDAVTCAAVVVRSEGFEGLSVVDENGAYLVSNLPDDPQAVFTVDISAPGLSLTGDGPVFMDANFDPITGQAMDPVSGETNVVLATVPRGGAVAGGTVQDAQGGAVLSGVRVESLVNGAPIDPAVVEFTCSDGSFEIARIDDPNAALRFTLANFEAIEADQPVADTVLDVEMAATQQFDDVPRGCPGSAMMMGHGGPPPYGDWLAFGAALILLTLVGYVIRRRIGPLRTLVLPAREG